MVRLCYILRKYKTSILHCNTIFWFYLYDVKTGRIFPGVYLFPKPPSTFYPFVQ